jgi:hypothetical protein
MTNRTQPRASTRLIATAALLALFAMPALAQQATPAEEAAPPQGSAAAAGPEAPAAPESPDARRVPYVSARVRQQIAEEVRDSILEQARLEGWAAPNQVPEWSRRIRLSGDMRARLEFDHFPTGNAIGQFPDFNAINTNKPSDDNGQDLANDRWLNVDKDRMRPRIRLRLGLEATLASGFEAGARLASGDSGSPVSSNQSLGASGGMFSKYPLWFDRAYLRLTPMKDLVFHLGRFENPFLTTDLSWSENANFDGVAGKVALRPWTSLRLSFTGGAFPLYGTGLSFPAEAQDKFVNYGKWLFAGQLGGEWQPGPSMLLRFGAALYWFHRAEGRLGGPCRTDLKDITCDSDESRPSFAQKGNTYRRLRVPSAEALANEALSRTTPRYQYFGLASRFHELVLVAKMESAVGGAMTLGVDAEYARNLGFVSKDMAPIAVSNCDRYDGGACNTFLGGNNAYLARVTLRSSSQNAQWDWSASVAYKYLQSDAVIDAFTDTDFGLGGTNLKGSVITVGLAVAANVWLNLRWFTADQVAGPPFGADVLQSDLAARF